MSDWDIGIILEDATEEQAERVFEKLVVAVEEEGLICGGGMSEIQSSKPKVKPDGV